MKESTKILSLLLGGVMALSTITACHNDGENSQSSEQSSSNEQVDYPSTGKETDIGKIVKTNNVIINNGITDYKILLPVDASDDVKTAASELKFFISEATNTDLSTTTEYREDGKYFSLGNTVILNQNNLSCTYGEVGLAGYKLRTVGDDICIYGYTDQAVIYGVYEYLERMFEFEYFYENIYNLNKLQTLFLYDFDCLDVPTFENRVMDGSFHTTMSGTSVVSKRRMRASLYSESFINPAEMGWGCWHNCTSLLSAAKYYPLHPEWYNDEFSWANEAHTSADATTSQLCYTAHGDEASLSEMIETTAQIMFEVMQAYPNGNQISMNMEDNGNECSCSACDADLEKYGARTSSVILFFNRVAPLLEQKLKAVGDRRAESFKISFYAYYEYQEAPVQAQEDANGNLTFTYAPEMKLNEHVLPLYANIKIKLAESINSKDNSWHYLTLKKWQQIAPSMDVWLYDAYFLSCGAMVIYDSISNIQEHLRSYADAGVNWMYLQIRGVTPTAFQIFKNYVTMKLLWNINEDIAALTDKFFKTFYGCEGDEMKSIYLEMRALMTRNIVDHNFNTDVQNPNLMQNTVWWPKSLTKSWYERCVAAEQRLIDNGEMIAADNVKRERISPLYMMVALHRETYSPNQIASYKSEIISLFDYFGYTQISERVGLQSALVSWV